MLHVNFLQYYFNHHSLEENKLKQDAILTLAGVPNLPKLLNVKTQIIKGW